jgi:hypothetical protein
MTTEEIALRILCAQIITGKPIGVISVRESFALAVTFEEQGKEVRCGRSAPPPRHHDEKISFDDDGL